MKTNIKRRLLLLSLACLLAVAPARALQRGDVNADGAVDVQDLSIIINVLLGKADNEDYQGRSNVTLDNNGAVDIADVSAAIDIILGKEDTDLEACYNNLTNKAVALPAFDAGTCDFVRGALFFLNTVPTDEALCSWGDFGIQDLNFNTWSPSTPQVAGAYYRLYHGVDLCNNYLAGHAAGDRARAEARFVRALHYFHLMDLFGNVPFSTAAGSPASLGAQVSRGELFAFVESELLDIAPRLAAPREARYGHADRAAAWMLLARLYLNAGVYTGTPQWDKARTFARQVIDSGYELLDDAANEHYTDFQRLFMGDNDSNGAQREIILPLPQSRHDGSIYGSDIAPWQGTNFINNATYDFAAMADYPNGTDQCWAGVRARGMMAQIFNYRVPTGLTPPEYARSSGDDRALFNSNGRQSRIDRPEVFTNGFAYNKFTGMRTDDGPTKGRLGETGIDFPLMRVAEAYLTFAEADMRLNGGTCTTEGLDMVNALRARSHAEPLPMVWEFEMCSEWLREFAFEGRRRSDLIRFDYYGLSKGQIEFYYWDWRGGQQNSYMSRFDRCRNVYPLPESALTENPSLTQNPGYGGFVGSPFTLSTTASGIINLKETDVVYLQWTECVFSDEYIVPVAYDVVLTLEGEDIVMRSGTTALGAALAGEELNTLLLDKLPGLLTMSQPPVVECAVRVTAHAQGADDVVSNTLTLNLQPHKVPVRLWYVIGSGVGDGSWDNREEAINRSMIAMYPSFEDPRVLYYAAHFEAGDQFKLIKTPGMWDEQWGTFDGNIDFPWKSDNSNNFSITDTGYYVIRLNTATDECHIDRLRMDSSPVYGTMSLPGDHNSWNPAADGLAAFGASRPEHHDWYGLFTFEADTRVRFAANGMLDTGWGAATFPMGTGESGADIKVPAGQYKVSFNDILHLYYFEEIVPAKAPAFELSVSPDGSIDIASLQALSLRWDEPAYDNAHGTPSYTVLMGLADNPAAEPVVLATTTSRSASVVAATLQQQVMALGGWDSSTLPDRVNVSLQVVATARDAVEVRSRTVTLEVKTAVSLKPGFAADGLWYIIGDCVGDGSWNNSADAVGVAMTPLYPLPTDNAVLRYVERFVAGAEFKLIHTPGSWDEQWGSTDGSLEQPSRERTAGNFVIPDDGYYELTLNLADNTLTIKRMSEQVFTDCEAITMPGGYQGWNVATSAMAPVNQNHVKAFNHNWIATLSVGSGGTELKFAANYSWGTNWGDVAFPVGIGLQNGANIPVEMGDYTVFFNDITGAYLFVGK